MGEKDTIIKEKFWYVGLCNVKGAYEHAYSWLLDEDFGVTEEKYKENNKGDSKELEIKWKASKFITDYFKINLEFAWKVLGMTDVEVEIDGKKKKMNKVAELTIGIKGVLEKDYAGAWGAKGFNKFLKETYEKYVIPSRINEMQGKVIDMVQDFHEEMKAFVNLTGRR